jgi:hypothetical protein
MSISLDVMHSKPGIYIICSGQIMMVCEVDASGRAYQIDIKTLKPGVELRPGRWNVDAITHISGPLQRTPE